MKIIFTQSAYVIEINKTVNVGDQVEIDDSKGEHLIQAGLAKAIIVEKKEVKQVKRPSKEKGE